MRGAAPSWLQVALHVQRQVVGAREGAVAEVALEGPVARVLAVVPCEFIGARELPAAAFPVAVVRLFACGVGTLSKPGCRGPSSPGQILSP